MEQLNSLIRSILRELILENLNGAAPAPMGKRRGRPPGSHNKSNPTKVKGTQPKRTLSPAGRAAIIKAVKLRWARQRREARGK